jgi:pimeloyl-ACP methyl ester carboxylesterase
MKIKANKLQIEVEDTGGSGPVVVLIMGLGMQLTAWPPELVHALVQHGYRVLRHDNRDVGLSDKLDHLGTPKLFWETVKFRMGIPTKPPYTLHDMALDTLGVLDALGVARAHIVGASMGGMIAQRVAIAAPQRTLSLTSIMSSSGARGLPGPRPEVLRALLGKPRGHSREAVMRHYVRLLRAIGSPDFPLDEHQLRHRIGTGLDRSPYAPQGTLRQLLAISADTSRAPALAGIQAPTLVLHGLADPLVPFACGKDTARRIAGARLVGITGMGHDLPPAVIDRLLPPMLTHFVHTSPPTITSTTSLATSAP